MSLGCINPCVDEPCHDGLEIPEYVIEPREDPLPFRDIEDFESWLREHYLFEIEHSTTNYGGRKVECLGIFSPNRAFERCCLQCPIPHEYSPEFQELLRGKITSHNHPSGETFSLEDIHTWADLQMPEIRVVAASRGGAYRTYSIKRLFQRQPTWEEIKNKLMEVCPQDPEFMVLRTHPTFRHRCLKNLDNEGFFCYSVSDTEPPHQV